MYKKKKNRRTKKHSRKVDKCSLENPRRTTEDFRQVEENKRLENQLLEKNKEQGNYLRKKNG